MKKKIFNGILLVAALFATSSAFVSCKDNDADEIANAKIAIQKDLNTQIADLKAQLKSLQDQYDAIKASIPDPCACPDWTATINDLKSRIATLEESVKSIDTISEADAKALISTQTNALKTEIENQMADIKNQILLLTQALDKVVYSMAIEGTYNPIFGALAAPVNVKSQVLAAYIGSDEMASFHGEKIKSFQNNDAGTIYFTVNPKGVELDGKFSLVNSIGETYDNVELTEAKKSSKVLTWGWNQTRASETGLYEMNVTVKDTKDIELDYKTIAKDIKNIITKRDQASVSSLMSDLYPSLVGGKYQRLGLQYDWSLTSGISTLEGSTTSSYDLAVMAVKPLGYDFEVNITKTPGIEQIENAINKMIDKIKIDFPNIDVSKADIEISKIEPVADGSFKVYYRNTVAGTTIVIDKDMTPEINNIIKQLNDALGSLDKVKDLLNEVKKINEISASIDKAKNDIKAEINSYLQKFDSKFVKFINSTNDALQPTLLVKAGNTIKRPGTVDAGVVTLVPTSWTAEVFAPAFKKYIKVENGSNVVYESVIDGTVNEVPVTLAAGTYKVTYDAIDFFGKTRTHEYTIIAK